MLIIGSHVSFKNDKQLLGSVEETISYGANAFMFYTGAPQNTTRSKIDDNLTKEAHKLMRENNIELDNIVCHAPYIVNLANENNFDFSVSFLKQEIARCSALGVKYLVLHPGNALDSSRYDAVKRIAMGLNIILDNHYGVSILLETMSGKGSEIGNTFEEIKGIIDLVNFKDKVGVCLDSCHINDAGYDISNFDKVLDDFDNIIGLDKLKCLHINDSKNEQGSHKDRHENFGLGYLGFDNLINIIYHKKIENIPKILETPYVTKDDNSKERLYPPYKFEIDMIKKKVVDTHLIKKIRSYYS